MGFTPAAIILDRWIKFMMRLGIIGVLEIGIEEGNFLNSIFLFYFDAARWRPLISRNEPSFRFAHRIENL
jgi:hypothetical protein